MTNFGHRTQPVGTANSYDWGNASCLMPFLALGTVVLEAPVVWLVWAFLEWGTVGDSPNPDALKRYDQVVPASMRIGLIVMAMLLALLTVRCFRRGRAPVRMQEWLFSGVVIAVPWVWCVVMTMVAGTMVRP